MVRQVRVVIQVRQVKQVGVVIQGRVVQEVKQIIPLLGTLQGI